MRKSWKTRFPRFARWRPPAVTSHCPILFKAEDGVDIREQADVLRFRVVEHLADGGGNRAGGGVPLVAADLLAESKPEDVLPFPVVAAHGAAGEFGIRG